MASIQMEAAKVIEAAKRTIDHIEKERYDADEAEIRNAMKPRKFLWVFNTKGCTREKAIDRLDNYVDFFGWRSQYAWKDLEEAKRLLKLAQHGDPVTLNEKDIMVLF